MHQWGTNGFKNNIHNNIYKIRIILAYHWIDNFRISSRNASLQKDL